MLVNIFSTLLIVLEHYLCGKILKNKISYNNKFKAVDNCKVQESMAFLFDNNILNYIINGNLKSED